MRAFADHRAGTQARVGADNCSGLHLRTFQYRMAFDLRAATYRDAEPEHDIGTDLNVRFQNRVVREEHCLRRDHADTVRQRRTAQPRLHGRFGFSEFGARVHTHHLAFIRNRNRAALSVVGLREFRNVGEIVFPLRVVVLEFRRPAEKASCIRRHDAGIAEIDFAFFCIGVAILDDPVKQSVLTRDHATISRALRVKCDNGETGILARLERGIECLRGHEWHVAIADHDVTFEIGERRCCGRRGVTGSELLVLDHGLRTSACAKSRTVTPSGDVTTTMRSTPAPRAAAIT